MVEITVEAEVRPTEDIEKVKTALLNIARPEDLEVEEVTTGFRVMRIKCSRIECLEPLRNMIKSQQIEPAFRAHLEKYWEGDTITILLHKQACYVGKISLIDSYRESPLGPIKLTIKGTEEELEKIIEYLTSE